MDVRAFGLCFYVFSSVRIRNIYVRESERQLFEYKVFVDKKDICYNAICDKLTNFHFLQLRLEYALLKHGVHLALSTTAKKSFLKFVI